MTRPSVCIPIDYKRECSTAISFFWIRRVMRVISPATNMFLRRAIVLYLVCSSIVALTKADDEKKEDPADKYKEEKQETCTKNDAGECVADEEELYRHDGVMVGYSKRVKLVPDKSHHINTLNMLKPLIFEIPEFVTDEESEHLIKYAEEESMKETEVELKPRQRLVIRDINNDQELSTNEMQYTLEEAYYLYFAERDLFNLYDSTTLDTEKDDIITKAELEEFGMEEFQKVVLEKAKEWPWVQPNKFQYVDVKSDTDDDVIKALQARMAKLLKLPISLVHGASLQILKFDKGGYQSGQVDSSPRLTSLPCCHTTTENKCRGCNFVSIQLYLSDLEEGGELAFMVANNETFHEATFLESSSRNMAKMCHKSKLRLKPKKGSAIVWYNHFVDGETGGMGPIDVHSWHGECPLKAGTKWILKVEIPVDDYYGSSE